VSEKDFPRGKDLEKVASRDRQGATGTIVKAGAAADARGLAMPRLPLTLRRPGGCSQGGAGVHAKKKLGGPSRQTDPCPGRGQRALRRRVRVELDG